MKRNARKANIRRMDKGELEDALFYNKIQFLSDIPTRYRTDNIMYTALFNSYSLCDIPTTARTEQVCRWAVDDCPTDIEFVPDKIMTNDFIDDMISVHSYEWHPYLRSFKR